MKEDGDGGRTVVTSDREEKTRNIAILEQVLGATSRSKKQKMKSQQERKKTQGFVDIKFQFETVSSQSALSRDALLSVTVSRI